MTTERAGRHRIQPHLFVLLLVVSLFPVNGSAQASSGTVRFTFAPPAPATYRETIRTTWTEERPEGTGRERVVISRNEIEMEKVEDGYRMTVRPEPTKQVRAGREMILSSNPIMSAIERAPFTVTLDADGCPVSVSGYEEVMARIQQMTSTLLKDMTPEQSAIFARNVREMIKTIEPEMKLNAIRADWDPRITSIVGLEMAIGEVRVFESSLPLSGEQFLPLYSAIRFEGMEEMDGMQAARLVYRFDTEAGALSEFAGRELADSNETGTGEVHVRGEGVRFVDPATLRILKETRTRAMTTSEPGPDGESVRVTRHETSEFTYDYTGAESTGD